MDASMSQEELSGAEIIEAMSRKDFHHKFVMGVGQTEAFGALVSCRAEYITPAQKQEVRELLEKLGIPFTLTGSDDELNMIAATAAARAVDVR